MAHEWTEQQIMTVLQEQGILDRKYVLKHSYILVCCPFHNEKNPSCSITFEKGGLVHCFAGCFDGTFTQFIYKLLGGYDKPHAVEYVRKFQNEETYKFEQLPRREIQQKVAIPSWDDLKVGEEQLKQFDWTDWIYSRNRGISEEVCRQFRVGIDYENGAITFPLKLNGEYRAICRRQILDKKFKIPTELRGRKPLAYIDEARELTAQNGVNKVVLVESIYNALTCYTYGIPAVATLGTPTDIQAEILKQTDIKEVLIACDGDTAGRVFALKWLEWLKDKKQTTLIHLPATKDVNDLVKDDPTGSSFNELIGKAYWEKTI